MSFGFEETMQGWLTLPGREQQPHPIAFSIRAFHESALEHVKTGHIEVTGVVHAAPLAEQAVVTGYLVIQPIRQRILGYHLEFAGAGGEMLHLTGEKHINWLSPIKSWTTLPFQIMQQDRQLATGVLHFDIKRDWLSFARSFLHH
jgi:hypothetical protein